MTDCFVIYTGDKLFSIFESINRDYLYSLLFQPKNHLPYAIRVLSEHKHDAAIKGTFEFFV